MSAAPFRVCDFKNFGILDLCHFGMTNVDESGSVTVDPPIWGASVIEQYREAKRGAPTIGHPDVVRGAAAKGGK